MRLTPFSLVLLGFAGLTLAQNAPPPPRATTQPTTQPAPQPASQPAPNVPELDRLRRENADLKRTLETLRAENAKLKKQWNEAVLTGSSGTTPPPPASAPATRPALDQDGPGLYRASAGPNGRWSTEFRAKSRQDALDKALQTVAQKAMDWDENVEIHALKVERIGP